MEGIFSKISVRRFLLPGILVGNLLEHYSSALYGFLVPFLASAFFPHQDPLTRLIYAYALMPLSALSRPAGALVFGYIGDQYGRQRALNLSLIGMAIVTVWMGFVPAYASIGFLAPLLLAMGRLLQGFFAAGEYTAGILHAFEQFPSIDRGRISSWYQAAAVGGIVLASCAATFVAYGGSGTWRIPYFSGGCTVLASWIIRAHPVKQIERPAPSSFFHNSFAALYAERKKLLPLMIIAGFNYSNFTVPFVLLNAFVPFVSGLSQAELVQGNILFLLLDFALFLYLGGKSKHWQGDQILRKGALVCAVLAFPLFALLPGCSWSTVWILRLFFVTFGIWMSIAYYPWAQEQIHESRRALVLGFTYSLGSQLMGVPTTAISLWIYQKTGMPILAAGYWALLGLLAFCMVSYLKRDRKLPI